MFKWKNIMPACLPQEQYDSELETAKTKKRTHFALWLFAHYAQTLQNATPRCESFLSCTAFFLPLWLPINKIFSLYLARIAFFFRATENRT